LQGNSDSKFLVGSEIFDLSALVLTKLKVLPNQTKEQAAEWYNSDSFSEPDNMITINLKRVSKNMSGEIKIKCSYKPIVRSKKESD
jgi:hypothetical protein